jgi:hypothetical protein
VASSSRARGGSSAAVQLRVAVSKGGSMHVLVAGSVLNSHVETGVINRQIAKACTYCTIVICSDVTCLIVFPHRHFLE